MTKPPLGVAIIIDNICTPESKANVVALKDAYDTAGFETHVHRNCNLNVSRKLEIRKSLSYVLPTFSD